MDHLDVKVDFYQASSRSQQTADASDSAAPDSAASSRSRDGIKAPNGRTSYTDVGDGVWEYRDGEEPRRVGDVEENDGGDVVVTDTEGGVDSVHTREGTSIEKDENGKWVERDSSGMEIQPPKNGGIKDVSKNKDGDVVISFNDGEKEVRRRDGTILKYRKGKEPGKDKPYAVEFKDGSGVEDMDGDGNYRQYSRWGDRRGEKSYLDGEATVDVEGDEIVITDKNSGSRTRHHKDGSLDHYDDRGNLVSFITKDGDMYWKENGMWMTWGYDGKPVFVENIDAAREPG